MEEPDRQQLGLGHPHSAHPETVLRSQETVFCGELLTFLKKKRHMQCTPTDCSTLHSEQRWSQILQHDNLKDCGAHTLHTHNLRTNPSWKTVRQFDLNQKDKNINTLLNTALSNAAHTKRHTHANWHHNSKHRTHFTTAGQTDLSGRPMSSRASGGAKRRRKRQLHSLLRHELTTAPTVLSAAIHHHHHHLKYVSVDIIGEMRGRRERERGEWAREEGGGKKGKG